MAVALSRSALPMVGVSALSWVVAFGGYVIYANPGVAYGAKPCT
jgi:hypothetical protein